MCGECGGKKDERNDISCQPRWAEEDNPCKPNQPNGNPGQRSPCIGDYERHMYETENEDMCNVGPNEPYKIPGYAGHVPTVEFRSGGTYGHDTHEAMMLRPQLQSCSYGKGTHICPVPLHEPYRIPGYTGHVPGLGNLVGGTYGQDTHKLLYAVQPYPNRQENLSPYRPGQANYSGNENASQKNGHSFTAKFDPSEMHHSTQPYRKPDEHYYKPQYKYRIGDTYATTADLTLIDPCVMEESKVLISTRELDDTQVVRTQNTLEERVQNTPFIYQPIRHRPVVPGFDAFVDALRGARGQRYEFNDQTPAVRKLQQQLILQRGRARIPLSADDATKGKDQHQQSQMNINGDNVPYGFKNYNAKQRYTNSVLYDFTSNYRRRQSTEWAPATISRPDPPAFDLPGEIYNQHTGLLPGYSAHIPGAIFRCGKTFTDDSRDAKRALRGDRF